MTMVGANPNDLDALAQRMSRAAAQLEQIHREAHGLIRRSPWSGPGAVRFEQQWRVEGHAQLRVAQDLLRSAADALRRNATEQRNASAAAGGTFGGGQRSLSHAVGTDSRSPAERLLQATVGSIAAVPSIGRAIASRLEKGGPPQFSSRGDLTVFGMRVDDLNATGVAVEGLVIGGLPGLVVASSLTTGVPLPDVLKEYTKVTNRVLREEDTNPRVNGFVHLVKNVPYVGETIDVSMIALDTAKLQTDELRYGLNAPNVAAERRALNLNEADFVVGEVAGKYGTGAGIVTGATDAIFGTHTAQLTKLSHWYEVANQKESWY